MTNLNTETAPKVPDTSADPSALAIEGQIEQIISNALGDKISPKEQAKLHNIGTVVATVVSVLLPLAKDKIDISLLQEGLFTLNQGFLLEEQGVSQILKAVKKPQEAA